MKNIMNPKLSNKIIQRGLCMGALLLSAASASAAPANSTWLTFQVDMTAQVGSSFNPPGDTVYAHGTFNGWGALTLTNNTNAANPNLYTGTINDTTDANGRVVDYKFVIDSGNWESPSDGNNRCATLPVTSGASLLLPAAFFDDAGPVESNSISFQVDMAEQLHLGNFNTSYPVYAFGSFGGWATTPLPLTNNPALNVTNAQGYITSILIRAP